MMGITAQSEMQGLVAIISLRAWISTTGHKEEENARIPVVHRGVVQGGATQRIAGIGISICA